MSKSCVLFCVFPSVIYILTLTALLAFSAGVHAYAYVEEPKWLETQRLFLLYVFFLPASVSQHLIQSNRTVFFTTIALFHGNLPISNQDF